MQISVEEWSAHKTTLAAELPTHDWGLITECYGHIWYFNKMFEAERGSVSPGVLEGLRRALEALQTATAMLRRYDE